jgi:hypothetical protein
MTHLPLAKRRALRRRHQAGAAMFVVSMMITVLGAVGMFALAAAATEVKTAGNERQNTQTHYLAEYGIQAFARDSEEGRIDFQLATGYLTPDVCMSLPLPSSNVLVGKSESSVAKFCRRFSPAELSLSWAAAATVAYSGSTPYAVNATAPGSLGPVPSSPGFYVEITDPTDTPGKGTGNEKCHFENVTVTSYGVTQPLFNSSIAYGSEGIELQRARVVAGPVCR